MADDMDQDRLSLSRALCCQIGMLCEDASVKARLTGRSDASELSRVAAKAGPMLEEARTLLYAAAALADQRREED